MHHLAIVTNGPSDLKVKYSSTGTSCGPGPDKQDQSYRCSLCSLPASINAFVASLIHKSHHHGWLEDLWPEPEIEADAKRALLVSNCCESNSDHSTVRYCGSLQNHHNAMLNDIAFLCVVCLFNTILVDNLYIAPNRYIVINDGPLDDSVLACNTVLTKD